MNEFSMLCRVLGSLFYRSPQDPLLIPLFDVIREGKLAASWPLEQDKLLKRLQKNCAIPALTADYNALFVGEACSVSPQGGCWSEALNEPDVRHFLSQHGVPCEEGKADHIGALLLAASWLEDHRAINEDENAILETLFARYIMPWYATFLGKVEAHAVTPFWRAMAPLTREAISAMWDELQESTQS